MTDEPLSLTVHNLPPAGDALAALQRSRRGRWQMLGLLLVAAAPVLASYFTYYVIRPEGRRNFGELIEPQRHLPEAMLALAPDGSTQPLEQLRGQWLLLSTSGAACGEVCRSNLYLQRQLRESMGREKDRMDWVWLVTDDGPLPADIAPALAQATVLRVAPQQLQQWLAPAVGHTLEEHLYLVDPMGNWMMRFPARLDRAGAAQAKRDLERLLRASSSWDKPGRGQEPH
ncbi:cytochrome c oxidase subunit I [Melaminivora jejuensis]